uniref:Peptidase S8/S53 domain-containing protein n=1 Tax=Amphimedon queenslandica TaxID=400682 RepID=A0A1X7T651_AMPQE
MEEFNQDKDIDLSPFPKENIWLDKTTFNLVKDHMRQFTSERYRNIISCYRAEDNAFIRTNSGVCSDRDTHPFEGISYQICNLFFPIWILLALIPEEEERGLTIDKLVVAVFHEEISSYIIKELRPLVGKGSLIIKKLTIMCLSKNTLPNITNLKEQLENLGNVKFEHVKLKVVVLPISKSNLEELCAASKGLDKLKLMRDYTHESNVERISIDDDVMKKYSDHSEEDDLAAETPLLKGTRDSPHKMFGDPANVNITSQSMPTNRVLIAILGYGCHQPMSTNQTGSPLNNHIIDKKNFTNHTAPVYGNKYFTSKTDLVICQTTYCNGTIANGATSKAIQWLREKWKETWKKKNYDNLLVLIPYGGQYMEDEMIQIHKATDEGIIIVCAAGDRGGGVVFPAALGTVLSVGVADNGPKGREVDIHVPVSQKAFLHCSALSRLIPNSPTPVPGCAAAAAIFTGLLALLVSRINHVLDSILSDPLNQALASAIWNTPGHLHTCVIRELLVSEGNGSHHPQLGYGDGEKIINDLLRASDGVLLEKLANVLLIDDASNFNKTKHTKLNTIYSIEKIDEEEREKSFHNLDGRGISVTVLDKDMEEKEEWIGENKTSFKPFPATGTYKRHGKDCASVLHTICPNASILCANNVEELYHLAFTDCINHEPPIDVISYSISIPSFYYDMCRVVNEAVVTGKIIVFAAGNTGKKERNTVEYPGRIGNILVVGGRDESHNRIGFSSVGREMDFLAEGEIGTYSGTSFAAPVVAGYIALLLQFIKENMNTDHDKIRAWSKNEEEAYEWRDIPAFDAAHNVYAMRTLLKLLVPKPQDHSEAEGFGCLDFSKLFPCYLIENSHELVTGSAKTKIHETLQKFYKHM